MMGSPLGMMPQWLATKFLTEQTFQSWNEIQFERGFQKAQKNNYARSKSGHHQDLKTYRMGEYLHATSTSVNTAVALSTQLDIHVEIGREYRRNVVHMIDEAMTAPLTPSHDGGDACDESSFEMLDHNGSYDIRLERFPPIKTQNSGQTILDVLYESPQRISRASSFSRPRSPASAFSNLATRTSASSLSESSDAELKSAGLKRVSRYGSPAKPLKVGNIVEFDSIVLDVRVKAKIAGPPEDKDSETMAVEKNHTEKNPTEKNPTKKKDVEKKTSKKRPDERAASKNELRNPPTRVVRKIRAVSQIRGNKSSASTSHAGEGTVPGVDGLCKTSESSISLKIDHIDNDVLITEHSLYGINLATGKPRKNTVQSTTRTPSVQPDSKGLFAGQTLLDGHNQTSSTGYLGYGRYRTSSSMPREARMEHLTEEMGECLEVTARYFMHDRQQPGATVPGHADITYADLLYAKRQQTALHATSSESNIVMTNSPLEFRSYKMKKTEGDTYDYLPERRLTHEGGVGMFRIDAAKPYVEATVNSSTSLKDNEHGKDTGDDPPSAFSSSSSSGGLPDDIHDFLNKGPGLFDDYTLIEQPAIIDKKAPVCDLAKLLSVKTNGLQKAYEASLSPPKIRGFDIMNQHPDSELDEENSSPGRSSSRPVKAPSPPVAPMHELPRLDPSKMPPQWHRRRRPRQCQLAQDAGLARDSGLPIQDPYSKVKKDRGGDKNMGLSRSVSETGCFMPDAASGTGKSSGGAKSQSKKRKKEKFPLFGAMPVEKFGPRDLSIKEKVAVMTANKYKAQYGVSPPDRPRRADFVRPANTSKSIEEKVAIMNARKAKAAAAKKKAEAEAAQVEAKAAAKAAAKAKAEKKAGEVIVSYDHVTPPPHARIRGMKKSVNFNEVVEVVVFQPAAQKSGADIADEE